MLDPDYATQVRDLTRSIVPKRLGRILFNLFFVCLLLAASPANALVQPIFGSAQGPTLLPGSDPDLTEDAQYIYKNVALSTDGIPVDAIVTIVKLKDMDIVGNTIDNVLSEDYRFEPLTNADEDKGYVEWQIRFVQDGTVSNAGDQGVPAYLDSFTLEAIDVDGEEFFAAKVTNSYTLEDSSSQPTDLVVSTSGDYTKFQSGSESVNPISALDTQYIVRINYENVHVISFRNGSDEENDNNNNRQNSVSFTSEVTFNTPEISVINSAPTVVDNTGNTVDVNDSFVIDLLVGANDVDGNLDKKTTQLIDPSDFTNLGSDGNPLVVPGVGTYDVDDNGVLSFTPLTDYFGPASILFSVSDDLGVSSNRGSLGLMVIDPNLPVVAITNAPLATLANQAAYPVSGTCTVGDGDVTVSIPGATPPSQAVTCSASGNWSASFDVSAVADGPNAIAINASQTDAAGNTGNALPVTAGKDASAPTIVITGAPIATLFNQAAYPVIGACTVGDGDVTVSIAEATPASQAVSCGAGGTWSASFDVSAIGDGPGVIDITASQTDAAGNTGNATPVAADKNTIPPLVAITGAPTATLANQAAYPVSGTCTAGDGDVTVSIAGATPASQAVSCGAGGTWSASFDVSAIGDGANVININASQTDVAGNIGNALQVEASKDSIAPIVMTNAVPIASLSNQAVYPVSGTCTAGDGNVTVNIAGATPASQAVSCSAGGTWSVSFDVSAIGDGVNVIDINVSQADAAGNTGSAAPVEASKDASAPMVATTSAPLATLVNQAAYPVNGTCTADDGGVTVSIAGATPASQVVTCSAGGTWSASFDVSAIGDGTGVIDINASQTDAAGNTGNAILVEADKDTLNLTVAILNAPAATVGPFNVTFEFDRDVTGFATGDIIVGNGSASNFVIVDGNTYTALITPDGNGDITIDIPANVAQDASSNGNLAASQVIVLLATDTDNDGIPDNAECPAGPPFDAGCPDSDGDGTPDFQDPDSDNDGIPDDVEVGNDPNNPVDTDGDGIPDYLDQDSDNDGIPDSVEGGSSAIDSDGDGIPDILENGSVGTDTDNDGIDDALDVDQTGGNDANGDGIDDDVIDRDGDGVANYLDLDSDNDGIPDMSESGSSGQDINGNDIDDAFDFVLVGGIDANMDGIVDTLPDTDNDTITDQFDLDADADGINDLQESGLTPLQISILDTDNNAVIDAPVGSNGLADAIETEDTFFAQLDQNGDGLVDTPRDTDGDTRPDFQDLDADNDGIHDLVEGSGLDPALVDVNNDGVVDDIATDADNDGISDSVDSNDSEFGSSPANDPVDTDGDLVADFRDLDTDNDGISDLFEAGILDPSIVDTDDNGELDNALTDADNDGIPDGGDSLVGYGDPQATSPVDTDGDGLPDIRDLDADNDSIPDVIEGGNQDNDADGLLDPSGTVTFPPPDTDNDGTPDYVDPDSNNDGTLDIDDAGNGGQDSNNDGAVDDTTDNDMDGVPDAVDGDPTAFGLKADKDKDGVADALDLDDDNDGIPDIAEGDGAGNDVDTDGDGLVDRLDHDSDSDGLPDSVEAVQVVLDADADGFIDNFTDANNDGLDDGVDPAMIPLDSDGDANPDFRDLDTDNDGLSDTLEANALSSALDVNADGILDSVIDADLDGLADIVDPILVGGPAGAALPNPDTDGDGLSNYRDIDSDNDGLADGLELDDSNGDGIPDGLQQGDNLETAVRGSGSFGPGGFLLLLTPLLLRIRRSNSTLPVATLIVFIGSAFPVSVFSSDINYCGRHNPLESEDDNDFNQCFYGAVSWLAITHVDPEGVAFGWSTDDDSDSGYKLLVGWHFKPRWFGELSYADLGEAGLSNSNPAITGTEKISYKIPGLHAGYYLYEPEARFNIYVKAGISSIDNETTTSRVSYDKQNSVGISGGLGLQWRSLNNGLFARLAADFYDKDASSIGLSLGYYFGGSEKSQQAAVDLDSDADGVMDNVDSCPDSAAGAEVDATGCVIVPVQEPEPVVAEVDSDSDGIVDSLDACPDSVKGAQVDATGCVELVTVITQINLTLEGVYFDNDSAEITTASESILDEAVAALKTSLGTRVEVQAHTDSNGTEEYNLGLSTRRAGNVRSYLISHGIEAERLTARGYGESKPKATNETREGRARNRRVEFKVIEKGQDN